MANNADDVKSLILELLERQKEQQQAICLLSLKQDEVCDKLTGLATALDAVLSKDVSVTNTIHHSATQFSLNAHGSQCLFTATIVFA